MKVYLNAANALYAKNLQHQTVYQLGQHVVLPYFKVFEQQFLPLSMLYQCIDQQILQVFNQAGWDLTEISTIPIFLGSTGYVIADCESRLVNNQPLPTEYSIAVISEYLQNRYQTSVYSFATSCTSATQGVHYAYRMLQQGMCQKALVIGFESFNRLTFEHFHSMHLLSSLPQYLPFVNSTGIVLGEGIGCLALSSENDTNTSCELLAVHSLTDNASLTENCPQALSQLISTLLLKTGLSASDISAVKVHSAGGHFDQQEMQVLSDLLPYSQWILPKAYLGHTLGASGAIETAFLFDCLQKGRLPEKYFETELPIAQNGLSSGYYLNYFLGFGGSNVGWLIKWGAE